MEKERCKSEGEDLDSFLADLEGNPVREIAGRDSGFPRLNSALDGVSPGLHLLVGPPSCGKTSFAKQLADQIARLNSAAVLFFTFTEKKTYLRLRTLARLSGLETREIRRGAGYLLHTYGVAKRAAVDADEMGPGWEKLRRAAEEAKPWLDRVYISECDASASFADIEHRVREVVEQAHAPVTLAVIDDAQRLATSAFSLETRLPIVAEKLRDLAIRLDLPLLATWPDLDATAPERWRERIVDADVVMVMREDAERKPAAENDRAIDLHVVKNRSGEKAMVKFDFFPASARFEARA